MTCYCYFNLGETTRNASIAFSPTPDMYDIGPTDPGWYWQDHSGRWIGPFDTQEQAEHHNKEGKLT